MRAFILTVLLIMAANTVLKLYFIHRQLQGDPLPKVTVPERLLDVFFIIGLMIWGLCELN